MWLSETFLHWLPDTRWRVTSAARHAGDVSTDLDFGGEHHDAARRHVEKLRRLRAAALQERERARLSIPGNPGRGRARTRCQPRKNDESSANTLMPWRRALRSASPTSGVSMKPKRARARQYTPGISSSIDDAAQRVDARDALDLDVQDHDLLVVNLVVLEVAQQRGGHEPALAHEKHRRARHFRRRCQQLGQLLDRHRAVFEFGTQPLAAVAPGDEHGEHQAAASASGTQPPLAILVALPATERQVDQQDMRPNSAPTRHHGQFHMRARHQRA